MKSADRPHVLVIFNRDFEGEGAEADPENCARADIRGTSDGVVDVLGAAGYRVSSLGVTDDVAAAVRAIANAKPDLVFNLCESVAGASNLEPLLPMLLDHAGIAYTGAGPLALALSVQKHRAKTVLRGAGVPTPDAAVIASPDELSRLALPFPLIVKPAHEDASVGITRDSVVHDRAALERQVTFVLARYRQPALVERYVEGREIYISMLGRTDGATDVLPLYEIDFSELPSDRPRIVSFEGKWVETSPEFHGTKPVPCADLPDGARDRIAVIAHAAFAAMDLRDYARLDVRLGSDGTPYVIDVNPNCDLSAGAGFARAAQAFGLGYADLVQRIVELALQRRPDADTIPLAARLRGSRRRRVEPTGSAAGELAAGELPVPPARRRARSL